MVRINLQEHKSKNYVLTTAQRDTLLGAADTLNLTIEPRARENSSFSVTAANTVGAVDIGDLSVQIEPKIGIPQLLSLACYAMKVFRRQEEMFNYEASESLPDVLALALASEARRAFAGGLLHSYRVEEEALQTVRGRIRIDEQIRRRPGFLLPVEVRYDEFTDDILENRLVKAAANRLGRMSLRSSKTRGELSWVAGTLEQVSLVEFEANAVPEPRFDRLNEHYRGVVGLARLILRHSSFQTGRGDVRAAGFLMDMPSLFQDFLTAALREELGASERTLCSKRKITLDEDARATLEPDLSWWDGGTCTFVGDAKYKDLTNKPVPSADLYQLLAYVTALDLDSGLLVYAHGDPAMTPYRVKHAHKHLEVTTLDLSGSLNEVLDRVRSLAFKVQKMREQALSPRSAA